MKQITVAGLCLFVCTYAHANQTTHHTLANSITAHNIGSFQHTITQNAFNSFGLQNKNILDIQNTILKLVEQNKDNPNNIFNIVNGFVHGCLSQGKNISEIQNFIIEASKQENIEIDIVYNTIFSTSLQKSISAHKVTTFY